MSNRIIAKSSNSNSGFSLLEAVVAILILSIGLIATAAAITYAIELGTTTRNLSNARAVIMSSIEEVESLRNSRRLNFLQIANVGSVDNTGADRNFNGFSVGYKEVSLQPGPDGINGTDDDLKDDGPDGIYGTPDDFDNITFIRSGYVRSITIAPLASDPSIKRIEVRVRYYSTNGKVGEIAGVSYINDEARTTF